ncbi:protein translocase subunit SecD [Paremcibacter congregatus]|uniref:protein translocase subunit SecD n=1 Tax=Paremcibacter congregatus TaxID=2043170 RepID=UPI0030ED2989|tara:strand:- start:996 stop:2600 length:1605 start_codon:yes stop_codon:yes gene_type:complete
MLDFPRWKVVLITLVALFGVVSAAPNFLSDEQLNSLPDFLPKKQLTLGLDLQGGVHLLMEVDLTEVRQEKLISKRGDIRDALRAANIPQRSAIRGDNIVINLTKPEQADQALDVLDDTVEMLGGSALTGGGVPDIEYLKQENGAIIVSLTEEGLIKRGNDVITQSIEVLRRRIDGMGTTEPNIQKQGEGRILIQVPGFDDPQKLKNIIGKTAKLSFQLVNGAIGSQDRVPPGYERLPMAESERVPGLPDNLVVSKRKILTGENLKEAGLGYDQDNRPVVSFRFDNFGGKRFADVTRKNVNRRFAIILDGEIISAPNIQSPILGGSGIITGNFTVESASELGLLLSAGALPARLTVVEERTVGPDLGSDNIEAGKIAAIIGLLAVMVYIILSYGMFGMVANFALMINISLIFGLLSTLGATLTMPGVAGIVLTIGMAVDANVLIFERVREEFRKGKKALSALDTGYDKAFSTIIDANVTTFIAALILFQFGTGPIKGFAVTLAIGVATSMFTAVSFSRMIISAWAVRKRPTVLKI